MATGRIHSIESFGALDGPGLRSVVFMQGCPLRCLFCHNPDSWDIHDGTVVSAETLFAELMQYRSFTKNGGVTFSGGEPLLQYEFLEEMLEMLKEQNVHTAIDTSGAIPLHYSKPCIDLANLLLLDIKSLDPSLCRDITGQDNKNALDTLGYCEQTKKPVWIRHVLLPGYTLEEARLTELANHLASFSCIEKVELLPFHKMGEYKWDALNRKYALKDTPAPTIQQIQTAQNIFKNHGFDL